MNGRSFTRERVVFGALLVLLAAAFTAFSVWQSTRLGRLTSVPNYDDVIYFLSGTRLVEAFKEAGFDGVLQQLRQHGLHAPFSTVVATTAFATLGYHDWAPYAFNFIVVLVYLVGLNWLFREWGWTERCLALAFFLCLPFATMAVVEFRPDLCWATLTGIGVTYGISAPDYFTRWRPAIFHALLCAVALLAKPSTFAMTLIVFGYSACLRYAIELVARRTFFADAAIRRWLLEAGVVLVATAPFTIPFGKDTWVYFWRNSFGENKAIWTYAGDSVEHLRYYLTGYGAINNVGWLGFALLAILLVAPIAAIVARDWPGLVRVLGIWVLVVVTWGINTWAAMKSPFLGGAFFASLIFGSAMEMPRVCGVLFRNARLRQVVLAIVALAGILLYRFPAYSGELNSKDGQNYLSAHEQAIPLLEKAQLRERPVIMFTQSGPLVPDNITIWMLRKGIRPRIANQQFARTPEDFESKLGRADLVFVQPAGMRGAFFNLPSEEFQARFREKLDADPRYELLGEVEGIDGKTVRIYERIRRKLRRENE